MPRTARQDFTGAVQHVMARGNNRGVLFVDDYDREWFVKRARKVFDESGIVVLSWALMTNHYHIAVVVADTPLRTVMSRLGTAHAMRVNRRQERTGHVFENRYQSRLVRDRNHFLEILRYIHLNPLQAGIVSSLDELRRHSWSGYAALSGSRAARLIDVDAVFANFDGTTEQIRQQLAEWMHAGLLSDHAQPVANGENGVPSGHSLEVPDLRAVSLSTILAPPSSPVTLRAPSGGRHLEDLVLQVCRSLDLAPADLQERRRSDRLSRARALIAYLGVFELGMSMAAMAQPTGLTDSGVLKATRRGKKMVEATPALCSLAFPSEVA